MWCHALPSVMTRQHPRLDDNPYTHDWLVFALLLLFGNDPSWQRCGEANQSHGDHATFMASPCTFRWPQMASPSTWTLTWTSSSPASQEMPGSCIWLCVDHRASRACFDGQMLHADSALFIATHSALSTSMRLLAGTSSAFVFALPGCFSVCAAPSTC